MKKEQILGLIRHILTFAGGLLVAKGFIDQTQETELIGAVITIIGSIWSVISKKTTTVDTPNA